MSSPPRRLLFAALAVLWVFVVVLIYYLYHPPFDADNVVGIASTLGDLGVVALLLLLAAALGHRALRPFTFESSLEALVIQIAVGYGLIAFGVYVLGFIGLLRPLVFWILLVAVLALLYRDVIGVWKELRTLTLPRATRAERLLSIFVVFALSIALLFALTPPTGWDGLQYHLVFPKLALQNARFVPPGDNWSLSFPSLVELLFTAAIGLKSDTAAQMLHWSFLVLTVGAVLVFCARYFSWRLGWLASAFLVSVLSVLSISTWAYNEAAMMFYTLTALFWTLRALESRRLRDFLLAGILTGLLLGEKYQAAFVPFILALWIVLNMRPSLRERQLWLGTVVLVATAFLLAVPWYVRNLIFVGNPVYPFVFGGVGWDAFRTEWLDRSGSGMLNDIPQLLALPVTMTVQGSVGGFLEATIGPLLLAFLPFNLLPTQSNENQQARRAVWFLALGLFAIWFVGVAQSKLLWQTRFLLPAFPLFAILAAEGWERLQAISLPQFSAQRFGALVIAVVLGLFSVSIVLATVSSRPWDVLLGIETRDEYLARNLGDHHTMAKWINTHLPGDARIVSLWEPRSYYIDRAIEPDATLDRMAHLRFLYNGDADAIANEWRRQGFSHVLLWRAGLNDLLQSGYDPIGAPEVQTLQELEAKHLHLMYDQTPLGATLQDGKFTLKDWEQQPYAIFELR
jgi:hypothetical protein